MATISKRISSTAWGDVDKTALGNAVAKAFASGSITRAQIKTIYLYVPDEAFGKDSDGNPTFAYTKCKLPVAEFSGGAITINRNGVHAAAAAMAGGRGGADLPSDAAAAAKRKLRGLYRKLKETAPDSLKESVQTIGRGRPFEELVKGSVEYAMSELRDAFEAAFKEPSPYSGNMYCPWSIVDTFADAIVVRAWGEWNDLAPDEFYRVTYSKDANGEYTFAPYEQWEVVELTYQPQTANAGDQTAADQAAVDQTMPVGEARNRKDLKRITEQLNGGLQIIEGRTIRAGEVMTAGVVNRNKRRYPAEVLREAVARMKTHLNESAGQGRLRKQVLGEIDHPSDKGNGQPSLLETVFKWNDVTFDGSAISVAGDILETSKGRDVLALVEGGIQIPLSMRGYGDSKIITERGESIEEVTYLDITGFDGVVEPGFEAAVAIVESQQSQSEDETMDIEQLKKLIGENPDLFKGLIQEDLDKMSADALKALEERIRGILGIDANVDLGKALQEAADAKKQLEDQKRTATIEAAIAEATKGLPYGEEMNKLFVEAVRAGNPQDEKAVKALVEAKKKEYDAIAAAARLAAMGMRGGLQVVGPVLENEMGTPEYARGAHEFTEALVRHHPDQCRFYDVRKPATINQEYATQVLKRFDQVYGGHLKQEARRMQEAETTVDLDLPYSAARAVIAQAVPQLIAASVFDFDVSDQSPTMIFFEEYAAESGLVNTVTNEAVTSDLDAWVALDHKRLTPGTVVVTSAGPVTYDEGDDYLIDYAEGQIYCLSTGAIIDALALEVDYGYSAIREGEMVAIQRAKGKISSKTMNFVADRLAQQISNEAVVYSRSQVGWDATARTLAMLVNDVRRKIDQGVMYRALAAVLSVANNSGGTWDSTASPMDFQDFVTKVGIARVKVGKRFYQPTALLMSTGISDLIANWDGFTSAGARPDTALKAEGFVGRLKNLPVFETTEFTDKYALIVARELVAYRVFQPMQFKGPYPTYSSDKLVAADQYYIEEFNGADVPIDGKGAYVRITT